MNDFELALSRALAANALPDDPDRAAQYFLRHAKIVSAAFEHPAVRQAASAMLAQRQVLTAAERNEQRAA